MPQLFGRASNVLARVSLPAAVLLIITIALVGSNITPYTHRVGVAIDQPAPFSHKHHFEELGIDCRFCHTTVETGAFAGIPPTELCYTCHSQIWTNSPLLAVVRNSYETGKAIEWNRVTDTPDYVYFDHSIHVSRGVSCYTCHGAVNEMNLTAKGQALLMRWCMDCHRNPAPNLRPKEEVVNPHYVPPPDHEQKALAMVKELGIDADQLTDCWVCHR